MNAVAPSVQRVVRLVPTAAAILVIAATLSLGRWQLHRAAEKRDLKATLDARMQAPALDLDKLPEPPPTAASLRFRAATANGHYLAAGQIYIDNRNDGEQTGYHVLTPLQLSHRVVLVNRGFLPRDGRYPQAPDVTVPAGEVRVDGRLALAQTRYFELSGDTVNGAVWQNLKLDRYAALQHLDVLPAVLLADRPATGLRRVQESPEAGIDMHLGYAFQWFSLAATTAVLYVYFTFFRKASSPS